jgi:hypothetical protein
MKLIPRQETDPQEKIMRQTISGLVAAIAAITVSAAPAMACGWYGSSCVQSYVPTVYMGCNGVCGGWAYERLPDPVQQYYYVNQGPTYTGPGNFAPYPVYREGSYHHPHYYGHRRMHHHYGYRGPVLRRYY